MDIETLEKDLNSKVLQPIYVLYGEETYLLENNVSKIKKLFGEKIEGINYILLEEENVKNLINEINTPAFGFEKKLIILKKTGILKKINKIKEIQTKFEEYLKTNLEYVKQNTILIIIEEKIDKLKLVEILEENAIVCNFQKLKPIQITKKLKTICNMYKVNVAEKDLMYLIEVAGTSMQNLINEIRKLIEYAGENGTIDKKAINLLVIPEIDSVIFNLTDELGNKNIAKSLGVLNDLLYKKEPIQMILITLYRHFKKLYLVKLAKIEQRDIKEVLELKPNQVFLVSKYSKQAKYFTLQGLRTILKELAELDIKNKTGLIDIEIGLEVVLCNNI